KRLQTAPFSLIYARRMNLTYSALEVYRLHHDNPNKQPMMYQQLLDMLDYIAGVVFSAIHQ
ncbi:uncharacterized protein BYT42DRAFT_487623, partial [Radiomyces spectabilis]|uniref:uncharacterized protein n=1 Tax=Radiomyces spectabilis TaxID=64574 RepID=UPI00222072B5